MPSRGRKFITEFLLPSLNEKRFGSRLMWLDIQKKVFQIQWNHKSASDWTTNDAAVYVAWDKRKGHYKPNDKEYYSKSKQRFRAALYKFIKLKYITELISEDRNTKKYCIGDGKNISGTQIVVTKSEKESDGNENSFQNVKQNPEDLVIDLNSIWNTQLEGEPQKNCFIIYNPEMKEEGFIQEEQVLTDNAEELFQDILLHENLQNNFETLKSDNNKENFTARETLNFMEASEDMKSLHLVLKTDKYNKVDDELERATNIERTNFHDYLCSVKDISRHEEWSDNKFYGIDDDLLLVQPFTYNS